MANEVLLRDQNRVTVLGGITNDSSQEIRMIRVDPSTGRILVDASGVDLSVTLADVSNNSTNTADSLYTMTSGVNVDFQTSGGLSLLTLYESNEQAVFDANLKLAETTYNSGTQYGIVYKGSNRFLHDFNYGNNGTVTTSGNNVFLGKNTGNFTMGSTATKTYHGSNNVHVGSSIMGNNTTGFNNASLGFQSLNKNTSGYSNAGLGVNTLYSNTTGYQNCAVGPNSMTFNTTGYENVAVGPQALYNNTEGYRNSAIGYYALVNNRTGNHNTAIGEGALAPMTSGDYNIGIGFNTGYGFSGGDKNIIIGYFSTVPDVGGSNQLVIGNILYGTGIDGVNTGISSGNLGIATKTPRRRLDILDTSNPQFRLSYTDNSVYTDFQTDSSGYLTITPSGSIITAVGDINPSADNTYDLGIEQTKEWANVYTRRISGNNNRMVLELSTNSPVLRDHNSVGTGVLIQHRGTTVAQFGDGSGNAYLGVGTTGPDRKLDVLDASNPQLRLTHTDGSVYTDFQTTSAGYLYVNPSGGRIGFGVANPSYPFDFNSNSSNAAIARFSNTNGSVFFGRDSNGGYLQPGTAGDGMALYNAAGSVYLDVQDNGVGIGTSSPSSKLHNNGSSGFKLTSFSSTTTAGDSTTYVFTGSTGSQELDLPAGIADRMYFVKNRGSVSFDIDPNGSEEIYSTSALGAGVPFTVSPGEAYILQWDGTYWNVM